MKKNCPCIVDSPGWSDPEGQLKDEQHFNEIVHFLRESKGINAFILLFLIQDR